jgi:hypothetical protein
MVAPVPSSSLWQSAVSESTNFPSLCGNMRSHTHVHSCMYVCTDTGTHMWEHALTHTCTVACMCARIQAHTRGNMRSHTRAQLHVCVHGYRHTHARTRVHINTDAHRHTVCTHTCICTQSTGLHVYTVHTETHVYTQVCTARCTQVHMCTCEYGIFLAQEASAWRANGRTRDHSSITGHLCGEPLTGTITSGLPHPEGQGSVAPHSADEDAEALRIGSLVGTFCVPSLSLSFFFILPVLHLLTCVCVGWATLQPPTLSLNFQTDPGFSVSPPGAG